MTSLVSKSDFIGLAGCVNLTSGGEPPLLKRHRSAFEQYASDKSRGYAGYWRHWTVNDEVRELLGTMLQLPGGNLCLLGSASEGICQIVSSVDWKPGDNAICASTDFASGRFALSHLKDLGVENRVVSVQDGYIRSADILGACDSKTRLVYASQVNYLTGQHLDIERLSGELATRGVLFLNDASHALGVTPVDGRSADFTVSCGYKWLLGTQMGILAWNKARWPEFRPSSVGWRSGASHDHSDFVRREGADRAQVGNANHLDVYLLRESLKYIQGVGIATIRQHVLRLGDRLIEALSQLDLRLTTPRPHQERAGNVCYLHRNPRRVVDEAASRNILIWGDEGRIRVSMHLFNDDQDIDQLIEFLQQAS